MRSLSEIVWMNRRKDETLATGISSRRVRKILQDNETRKWRDERGDEPNS